MWLSLLSNSIDIHVHPVHPKHKRAVTGSTANRAVKLGLSLHLFETSRELVIIDVQRASAMFATLPSGTTGNVLKRAVIPFFLVMIKSECFGLFGREDYVSVSLCVYLLYVWYRRAIGDLITF